MTRCLCSNKVEVLQCMRPMLSQQLEQHCGSPPLREVGNQLGADSPPYVAWLLHSCQVL